MTLDQPTQRICVICRRRQYHHAHACGGCRTDQARNLLEIDQRHRLLPYALDTNPHNIIDLTMPARGGASATTVHDPNRDQNGELPIAAILDSWVRDWQQTLPNMGDTLPAPTVPLLVRWLYARVMTACDLHPAVDEYAAEIRALTAAIRRGINHNPIIVHYRAPCPYCLTQTLRREPGADWIECKGAVRAEPGCGRLWGEDEYGLLARAAIAPDELLDTTEAAIIADVEPATIRKWVQRGHLVPSTHDPSGRALFRKAEVEDARNRPSRLQQVS